MSRAAILHAIRHEPKSIAEIGAITGRSLTYIRVTLIELGDEIETRADTKASRNGQVPTRYISRNATPAPIVERVVLPGWAAALAL